MLQIVKGSTVEVLDCLVCACLVGKRGTVVRVDGDHVCVDIPWIERVADDAGCSTVVEFERKQLKLIK